MELAQREQGSLPGGMHSGGAAGPSHMCDTACPQWPRKSSRSPEDQGGRDQSQEPHEQYSGVRPQAEGTVLGIKGWVGAAPTRLCSPMIPPVGLTLSAWGGQGTTSSLSDPPHSPQGAPTSSL